MARMTYVIRDGVLVEKHLAAPLPQSGAPAILPDIQPFVSAIDGSVITGRAALRAHCKQHDVVLTADLAGLPPKPAVAEYRPSKQEREATREFIAYQLKNVRN